MKIFFVCFHDVSKLRYTFKHYKFHGCSFNKCYDLNRELNKSCDNTKYEGHKQVYFDSKRSQTDKILLSILKHY